MKTKVNQGREGGRKGEIGTRTHTEREGEERFIGEYGKSTS